MAGTKREISDPVTMGHIRGHGVTRLIVYCESLWCNPQRYVRGALMYLRPP
jgi:hypothetical protein